MLAPRQRLWSTPAAVVNQVVASVPLEPDDVVVDVGCGDGRVLLAWAAAWTASQENDPPHPWADDDDGEPENVTITTTTSSSSHHPSFIGIDIEPDRIRQARQALQEARQQCLLAPDLSLEFVTANAWEVAHLFQARATVLFLYLIPRGLAQLWPVLIGSSSPRRRRPLRIVTYLAPFPRIPWQKRILVPVPHHPGAAWPVFFYILE